MASFPAELQAQHGIRTFRLERTCCYEALLVDEERGRLFVGAENHVASLSLDNISKRAKKVPGTPNLTQLTPVLPQEKALGFYSRLSRLKRNPKGWATERRNLQNKELSKSLISVLSL